MIKGMGGGIPYISGQVSTTALVGRLHFSPNFSDNLNHLLIGFVIGNSIYELSKWSLSIEFFMF
jgi:hypothetical protein